MSDPRAKTAHLAAKSPESPPLEPPDDLVKSCGFVDSPKVRLAVCKDMAVYGTLPLTRGIAPAFLINLTTTASSSTLSRDKKAQPIVHKKPF